MEADGDFEKLESIQVIRLFTSSIDVVDSYLAIRDKEVRTMYIKALGARGQLPSGSILSTWRVLKQFA